jgi:hypothetical protein
VEIGQTDSLKLLPFFLKALFHLPQPLAVADGPLEGEKEVILGASTAKVT